jgi:hypothetical protein
MAPSKLRNETVENAMAAFMRRGKPLSVDVLGIVHEDAGSGGRMLDRQSRDVRVFQPPAEDVKAQASEVGVNIAGDRIRGISEMLPECCCGLITVALKEISGWCEGKRLNFPLELGHWERFAFAKEKNCWILRRSFFENSVTNLRYRDSVCSKAASFSFETKKR